MARVGQRRVGPALVALVMLVVLALPAIAVLRVAPVATGRADVAVVRAGAADGAMVRAGAADGAAVRAGAAAGGRADATVTVWTWNVAGWAWHKGKNGDMIATASTSIRDRGAQLVALNELCRKQYEALRDDLRQSGWPRDKDNFSRFEAQSETGCDGEPFGVAVFSREPMGKADAYALTADGTAEQRTLLCAPQEGRPHLVFCTTHITSSRARVFGERINKIQLGEVRDRLEDLDADGHTVILAGDFNIQPDDPLLTEWYSAGVNNNHNSRNSGAYRELDDTDSRCVGYGESTMSDGDYGGLCHQGRKLDMIFVRENRIVGPYEADSRPTTDTCRGGPCSDHRILVGTVTVSVSS